MTLDVILKEIQKAEKIVILTHEAPDGDAIGSSLGLKLSLEKIGKKSDLIMTKHARTFDFLPASNEIKTESNAYRIEKEDRQTTIWNTDSLFQRKRGIFI